MAIKVTALALAAALFSIVSPSPAATLLGEAMPMGEGMVRSYLDVGADDTPAVIGIVFDGSAFRGLPPMRNTTSRCYDMNGNGTIDDHDECEGDTEFQIDLPANIPNSQDIPFRWIGINWNPEGHDPPGVWSVPHFDMHFYIAKKETIAGIRVGSVHIFHRLW